MRPIPTTIAPNTLAGLIGGDRSALHQLFDEYAPALAESADDEVHVETAAANIVEHVFERAWQERRDFTTPEGLHDWFVRETHAMSVREQVRRAGLRRFDAREDVTRAAGASKPHADYDVAAGWARLEHRLDLAEVDPAAAAALRYEASRHGAAAHIAHVGEGPPIKRIVGSAVVLLAIGAFIFWKVQMAGADFRVTRALADPQAHAIGTAVGERARVKLEDGTQVTMAAEDSVTVPKAFNQEFRAVRLRGAARFEVASNPKLPFEVRAGTMQIVATGTTFTVSAYAGEPVVVTVQDGAVSVTVGKDVRTVSSGAGLMLSSSGVLSEPTAAQRDEATMWADGRFVIADRTVRASLPMFRRWFSMDLRPEERLLDRRVSMSVPIDSGLKAIAALEQVAQVKQIWVRSQMVVVDAPPAAKKSKK